MSMNRLQPECIGCLVSKQLHAYPDNTPPEKQLEYMQRFLRLVADARHDVGVPAISRDIKNLDLIKVTLPDGTYCYAQKDKETNTRTVKYRAIFMETVISVDHGQNIVAVKCHTGMGNAACAAIDRMELDEVVGTLAGDDTVFILTRDTAQAAALVKKISEMIGR